MTNEEDTQKQDQYPLSHDELVEFWREHRRKEQEKIVNASDDQPHPTVGTIEEQRPHKSYEAMRAEWQKRRGLASRDEETVVMTDEQKQQQENYLRLKSEFYHRMGREMPETKTKEWEDRLKRDQAKYNNWR